MCCGVRRQRKSGSRVNRAIERIEFVELGILLWRFGLPDDEEWIRIWPISCTIVAMIDQELLAILVCPECKVSVTPKGEGLKCPRCRRVYPIKDDIPVMLLDEATVDPE